MRVWATLLFRFQFMGSQTFSCQEHPAQPLDSRLIRFCHRDPHLTFSVAWWDFVHSPHSLLQRGRYASENLQSRINITRFIHPVKNVQLQTNHDPQEKLNYFSHFWGPLLSPTVTHERPGASVWESVWTFRWLFFWITLQWHDSTSQVAEDVLHPLPQTHTPASDPRRSRDSLRDPLH